jgi:hypothetical protein
MGRSKLTGRQLARLFAAGRMAIGAAVAARPEVLARGFRVDSATARRTAWLARMFGVRDMVLGAGTLFSLGRSGAPGPWLLASAVSDAGDAAALTGAIRRRQVSVPPAALGAVMAVVSVGVHAAATRPSRGAPADEEE